MRALWAGKGPCLAVFGHRSNITRSARPDRRRILYFGPDRKVIRASGTTPVKPSPTVAHGDAARRLRFSARVLEFPHELRPFQGKERPGDRSSRAATRRSPASSATVAARPTGRRASRTWCASGSPRSFLESAARAQRPLYPAPGDALQGARAGDRWCLHVLRWVRAYKRQMRLRWCSSPPTRTCSVRSHRRFEGRALDVH